MTLRSIYSHISKLTWLLTRELGLWIALLGGWLLSVYFCQLPKQKVFLSSLADHALTILLLAALVQVLPLAVNKRYQGWVRGLLRVLIIGCSVGVSFVESFICKRFHMTFEPTMFCLIDETNPDETSEFVSLCLGSQEFLQMWPYLCLILFATLAYFIPRCRHSFPSLRLAALVGIFALILQTAPSWCKFRGEVFRFLTLSQSSQAERVSSKNYYTSTLRLAYSYKFYALALNEGTTLAENTLAALPSTKAAPDSIKVPNIILVIGESYNKHHASAYGYALPTTPYINNMQRRGSLTTFTDVVTPWNITSQAMKWIMSSESIDTERSWAEGALWPAIFKHAGWQVAFVTNQYIVGATKKNKIDLSGGFFLNKEPLDSLAFTYRNRCKYHYDEELFSELDSIRGLYDNSSPNLTIFHMIGQHMEAKNRVPSKWCKFTEKDYDRPDLTAKQLSQLVAYDNATLYNDYVFFRLCTRFQREDAVVIYFSDHGEEVFHPNLIMYGRNHEKKPGKITLESEYEIPFMIWTSKKCQRMHPDLCASIREAAGRPFISSDVAHLVMGIAHIRTHLYNPTRDLLSPTYDSNRPRLIRGQHPYVKK